MGYAILRIRKISTAGQISEMQRHNYRLKNVWNMDPQLTHVNKTYSKYGSNDLKQDIDFHINQKVVKQRKNSVKAIEHLITFSPEFSKLDKRDLGDGKCILFGNVRQIESFFRDSKRWLEFRYGKDNLVHYIIHYDEKTPHMHAYVVPIKKKQVNWKNRNGQGTRSTVLLCARDYFGGKEKMREMQDSFHKSVEHHGLQRGERVPLAKGEYTQEYYSWLNQMTLIEQDMNALTVKKTSFEVKTPRFFDNKKKWSRHQTILAQEAIQKEKQYLKDSFIRCFSVGLSKILESASKVTTNLWSSASSSIRIAVSNLA